MRYFTFVILVILISCKQVNEKSKISTRKAEIEVVINVHPGVELLTIIQKLAGKFPKSSPSKYNDEVMEYFSKYKEAKAVEILRNIDKNIYPDFTELGFCFSDFPKFKLHIPEKMSWYKYYGEENVKNFLKSCQEFVVETNFWDFYKDHENQYKEWSQPIRKGLKEDKLIEKLDAFYKSNSNPPSFYICLDPLNGWGAHAIVNPELYNPDYEGVKAYTIGFFGNKSKDSAQPKFEYGSYSTNLIWHEGGHIYLEPIFKKYKKEIDEISYLFNKDDEGMKNQNISNWEYCLNENVVRAIVISLFKKHKTNRAWKKQNAQEIVNDFIYAEYLSECILEGYLKNDENQRFEDYFPFLLKLLKKKFPVKRT